VESRDLPHEPQEHVINISLQGSHEANKEQAVEGQRIDREASQRNSHEQTNHVRLTDDEIIDDSTEQGHSRQVDVDEMGREPPVPQPRHPRRHRRPLQRTERLMRCLFITLLHSEYVEPAIFQRESLLLFIT